VYFDNIFFDINYFILYKYFNFILSILHINKYKIYLNNIIIIIILIIIFIIYLIN